jgi:CDP-diacylglycerol--glycerol-3-phosphate 3-phosphatidyltransferase
MEKIRCHIANILTIFRILTVPFFVVTIFGTSSLSGLLTLVIFSVASLTDYFDGYIARKWGVQSRFGTFLDPLADKILTGAAFISFAFHPFIFVPFWLVIIILLREVTLTFFRIAALNKRKPIKTEYVGKIKTAFQIFSILCILGLLFLIKILSSAHPELQNVQGVDLWRRFSGSERVGWLLHFLPLVLVAVSAFIALASMIQYLVRNWNLLFSRNMKNGRDFIIKMMTSGFFIGYVPFASGTVGSFLGAAVWMLFSGKYVYYYVTFFFLASGFALAGYAEKNIFAEKDSSKIIIDEISGILIAFTGFHFSFDLQGLLFLITGFFLFRLLDILKPAPIRNLQSLRGAWGIMLDDIAAGLFTQLLLRVLRFLLLQG